MKNLHFWIVASVFALTGCLETMTAPVITKESEDPGTPDVKTSAPPYVLAVRDPVGDQTGPIDAEGMLLVFDPATGEYSLYVIATAERPFQGTFRININLYNKVLGPSRSPSFFSNTMNDFTLQRPQSMIRLSGMDPSLLQWKVNQRVFTNSLQGTGNPQGVSLFRSSVWDPTGGFLDKEDVLSFADLAQPGQIAPCTVPGVYARTQLTESQVRAHLAPL